VSGWQGARELHSDHGSVVVYRGMVDCFVRTVREEGFQALFKVCYDMICNILF
jgi:solute carrier family 25 phosphate transporter 23/24/25/41